MLRRLASMFGAALLVSVGIVAVVGRLGRDFEARVAVRGHSMEPTLVDGDWLLVDPDIYRGRAPKVGEIVVARDPRESNRVIVKRVAGVASDGAVTLTGDHPAHDADGSAIGAVSPAAILGRAWFRYWPTSRFGRVG
jgi:nickel-type superoxide dismutase maturation protease